jgi:hypothetical protein
MSSGAEQMRRGLASQFVKRLMAVGVAAALAGCVESVGDLDASAPSQTRAEGQSQPQQADAAGAVRASSPRAASAAFTRLEGAPAPVMAAFIQKLAAETRGREITSVQPDAAKYIVHGYLSVAKTTGGVIIGYVWDVFDSRHQRVHRIEDQIKAPGAAADPWSLANDKVLGDLAAKSAADLANLLSQMPEALSDAGGTAAAAAGAQPTRAPLVEAKALR